MLYPKIMGESDLLELEIDCDADNSDGDSDYTPRPDEDDNEPMVAAKFVQQSSIGVSFYLHKNTSEIKVNVGVIILGSQRPT